MSVICSNFLANFTLPVEGAECPFKEIIYTDLAKEEAGKLVAEYNKVSANECFPWKKKLHQDSPENHRIERGILLSW